MWLFLVLLLLLCVYGAVLVRRRRFSMKLPGRVAVITGAGSGIGRCGVQCHAFSRRRPPASLWSVGACVGVIISNTAYLCVHASVASSLKWHFFLDPLPRAL